ncbi:MAG: tetratricopeptide repeat protein [Candidatus Lokiarchaeota archaeon]|nr:tetratricopeptide repeat protein [Candidatus Lokiarchaeota archaeon]MBD3200923.1 tetratricopeptide repeat protein [Candidatus Lokiarchaeota archaeon]
MGEERLCQNCGAKVPSSNICLRCGSVYNPIQAAFANKLFDQKKIYSAWLVEAPSFQGMMGRKIEYTKGLKDLEKMRLDDAINYYNREVINDRSDYLAWNNLGVAYMGKKNRKNAMECYKKAVELNPKYYIGMYNIGAVYYECQEYEKAIEFFDKALEINPDCGEAKLDRHLARENLGHFDFEWNLDVMKGGANLMRARLNQSSALVDLGNGDDAVLGSYRLSLKDNAKLLKLRQEAIDLFKNKNINQAQKILENCLQINPEDPKAWDLKGRILLYKNDYEHALPCYQNALKIDSNSLDCWLTLGAIYALKKDLTEVIKCLNNALKINPFHKEVIQLKSSFLKQQYNIAKEKGNYKIALQKLDDLSEENPNLLSDILVEKGIIYWNSNNIPKAFNFFNQALVENPKNILPWLNKGSLYLTQKKNRYAFECYKEALKISPNNPEGLKGYHESFSKIIEKHPFRNDMESYKNFYLKYPDKIINLLDNGLKYSQAKRLEEALNCIEKVLELNKNIPEAWVQKANIYLKLQNYEMAIQCFDEVIKYDLNNPVMMVDVWQHKGVCHRQLNEFDKALKCYDEVLKINPKDGLIWGNMANIYIDLSQPEMALRCSNKAIQLGSYQSGHNTIAKNSKGIILMDLERYEEALKMFDDVLEFNPVFSPTLVGKAKALLKLNNANEALVYLDRSIKSDPSFMDGWYYKAKTLFDLKRYREAYKCYEEILRRDSDILTFEEHIKFKKIKELNLDQIDTQSIHKEDLRSQNEVEDNTKEDRKDISIFEKCTELVYNYLAKGKRAFTTRAILNRLEEFLPDQDTILFCRENLDEILTRLKDDKRVEMRMHKDEYFYIVPKR